MSENSTASSVPEEKLAGARDYYEWYLAYLAVGFTEEQAWGLMTRPAVNITPTQFPPEMFEFWERQNAAALAITDELTPDD